jgi:hypothetical protein
VRRIALLLAATAGLGGAAAPAAHGAFGGAFVPNRTYDVIYAAVHLLPRVFCPPRTTSTPREGDFSFCRGTLTVTHRGRLVARAPFSVRSYDSHVIKLFVRPAAKRLFPPRRRVRLRWVARSHDGQGQTASRAGSMTVVNRYKR